MAAEKHFLVSRDARGLRRIEVYEDQGYAMRQYDALENRCESYNLSPSPHKPYECCLFGSDSLATLVRTHASWFAPETLDTQALLADIAREVSAGPEGGEG